MRHSSDGTASLSLKYSVYVIAGCHCIGKTRKQKEMETAPHQQREKQEIEEMGCAEPQRKIERHCGLWLSVCWMADSRMDTCARAATYP